MVGNEKAIKTGTLDERSPIPAPFDSFRRGTGENPSDSASRILEDGRVGTEFFGFVTEGC